MTTRRIRVATLGAPHGIKGLLRVFPVSDRADLFDVARTFYTGADGEGALSLRLARADGKGFLVEVEGIRDRTAAQSLTGTQLWLERAAFPEPAPGEYYHVDLIGLRAVDGQGRAVGTVVGVENFGAGDLLDIKPEAGESFYLPFTNANVPDIDLNAGTMRVDLPEGVSGPARVLPVASADGEG